MFAGEAEGRLDGVLTDAAAGKLVPVYDFLKDLPGMEGGPAPFLPKRYVARTLGLSTSFDAGRGCPYQCSFCTIINVQGRKSRFRSTDDVEHLIRLNWAQGIHKFFITDDNFARNKEWESIFDRLIELRRERGYPAWIDDPSRRAVPQNSELYREGQTRRRARGSSSGWRTSTRTILRPRRSGRTKSPNIARCCLPGRRRASSRSRAISWAFLRIPPRRSGAISPSCRRSFRSTSSSSSV